MAKHNYNSVLYGSLIVLECLFWGIGNPVTKIALETIPVFYMLGIRFAFASLLMFLLLGRRIVREFKREHLASAIIIGLLTAGAFILCTLGLKYTTATIVGFLVSLSVVFTPILAFFLFRERMDKRLFIIIALVVAGMYLLCGNTGRFLFGLGELCCILGSVAGSAMLIYSGRHVGKIGPFALSTIQMAVCSLVCFIFAFFLEDFGALAHASLPSWISAAYIAIFCTCVAYILQNIALRKVSATFVGVAFCSEPVFTVVAAYLMLGETLSLQGFIGCVLIIAGIVPAALLDVGTDRRDDTNVPKISGGH